MPQKTLMLNPVLQRKVLPFNHGEQLIQLTVSFQATSTPEPNISVEVAPQGDKDTLPEDAIVEILDAEGKVAMLAVTCATQKLILEFSGQKAERFAVRISSPSASVLQSFTI